MSIPPEEIVRIAKLSGLTVPEAELERLGDDVAAILEFVSAINAGGDSSLEAFRPGPAAAPLRDDDDPTRDVRPDIEAMAPEFKDGFFLVPRPPGVEPV